MPKFSIEMLLARASAGVVAAGALFVFAVGMFGSGHLESQVVDHGMPCLFRSATGLVCPLCGMTHAIAALGSGDFAAAFAAHPLAPFVLIMTLWMTASLALNGRLQLFGRELRSAPLLAGVAVVWVVNLTAFLVR
jgi:hypothetical protein